MIARPKPPVSVAPAPVVGPDAGLCADLLRFPARALCELPIKVGIRVYDRVLNREIELSSGSIEGSIGGSIGGSIEGSIEGPSSRPMEGPREGLMFDGSELRALALGVEAERLFPADFKGYCLLKLHDPSYRLTEAAALDGVEPEPGRGWTLAEVLRALELELVDAFWQQAEQQAEQQTEQQTERGRSGAGTGQHPGGARAA